MIRIKSVTNKVSPEGQSEKGLMSALQAEESGGRLHLCADDAWVLKSLIEVLVDTPTRQPGYYNSSPIHHHFNKRIAGCLSQTCHSRPRGKWSPTEPEGRQSGLHLRLRRMRGAPRAKCSAFDCLRNLQFADRPVSGRMCFKGASKVWLSINYYYQIHSYWKTS